MIKKTLNQNAKYVHELKNSIDYEFNFAEKPVDRFKSIKKVDNRAKKLSILKQKINSIENCNLKDNSKNLLMGDGDINSPIMLIGESPGLVEDSSGVLFQGESGKLLTKMLLAIDLRREKVYLTYSINFRPPEDRKPTSQEIKRYSIYLKEHISIIDPKLIILLGGTALEAVMGFNGKVSEHRGAWKEIILNNKTYPLMITYSPSYLIRYPDNKKSSWEDLKKIRQEIFNLKIRI